MNPDKKDKHELIKYRLQQATDAIDVVTILIVNEKYPAAVNRIYYGMFYALLALAVKYDFESSKHKQLIGWFNKEFVLKGRIEKNFGKVLRKAYESRTSGDYDTFVEFEKNDVVQFLPAQWQSPNFVHRYDLGSKSLIILIDNEFPPLLRLRRRIVGMTRFRIRHFLLPVPLRPQLRPPFP